MVTLIKSFFALLLPKTKKIRILKKMKKWLEISSFYICVPKITIKNETTQNIKIFEKLKRHLDISSFYTCAPSMKICFLRYKVQQTEFFVILGHFLPFYLPDNPENQNFEKLKTKTKKKHLNILSFYKFAP